MHVFLLLVEENSQHGQYHAHHAGNRYRHPLYKVTVDEPSIAQHDAPALKLPCPVLGTTWVVLVTLRVIVVIVTPRATCVITSVLVARLTTQEAFVVNRVVG